MTDPSVTEPDPWAEISAELHRIADDLLKLVGQPKPSMFHVHMQVGERGAAAANVAVDLAGIALLGKPGTTRSMSGGTFHRDASGHRGRIEVSVYQRVPGPDDELERLRARVAELEARDDGQGHSRVDDGEGPQSVGRRVEPHYADGQTGVELDEPKSLFAPGASRCGAHTPDGPCVLLPGHTELCEPDDEDPRAWEG